LIIGVQESTVVKSLEKARRIDLGRN